METMDMTLISTTYYFYVSRSYPVRKSAEVRLNGVGNIAVCLYDSENYGFHTTINSLSFISFVSSLPMRTPRDVRSAHNWHLNIIIHIMQIMGSILIRTFYNFYKSVLPTPNARVLR